MQTTPNPPPPPPPTHEKERKKEKKNTQKIMDCTIVKTTGCSNSSHSVRSKQSVSRLHGLHTGFQTDCQHTHLYTAPQTVNTHSYTLPHRLSTHTHLYTAPQTVNTHTYTLPHRLSTRTPIRCPTSREKMSMKWD